MKSAFRRCPFVVVGAVFTVKSNGAMALCPLGCRYIKSSPFRTTTTLQGSSAPIDVDTDGKQKMSPKSIWESLALSLTSSDRSMSLPADKESLASYAQTLTLLRVSIPALLASVGTVLLYPPLSLFIAELIDDAGVFSVVSQDSSQYIQNILTTLGLTFSILVGQTFYFMYQQQESVYYSLFDEVTVAKSLLEQIALMTQGRGSMYRELLQSMRTYVNDDLKKVYSDPAVLLSARPMDDPLESIMYITSVGEPSVVYDTVKELRTARAARLGALQRKLPEMHMILLWSLAGVVLATFPLLGAGSQTIGGMGILEVQASYMGIVVFGIVCVMGVINELRDPRGGAYNVDNVLHVMVGGLEEELESRVNGRYATGTVMMTASPTRDNNAYLWKQMKDDKHDIQGIQDGGKETFLALESGSNDETNNNERAAVGEFLPKGGSQGTEVKGKKWIGRRIVDRWKKNRSSPL